MKIAILCLLISVVSGFVIDTVVGSGECCFSGDDPLPAKEVVMNNPGGVNLGPGGNIFISEKFNHRVRKWDLATNIVSNVAGNGTVGPTAGGFGGDGGPATSALLAGPTSVAFDSQQNMYIADVGSSVIRRVSTAGIISTFVGNLSGTFGGDGLPVSSPSVSLFNPSCVIFDNQGNLLIADQNNHRVRKVDAVTQIITTIAGNGVSAFGGDGGLAIFASLSRPFGLAVHPVSGDIFIADRFNNRVRKIDILTGIITTVVGNGTVCFGDEFVLALASCLSAPTGLAFDPDNNLIIADKSNHRIRFFNTTSNIIHTIAGTGSRGFNFDNAPATLSQLNDPTFVTFGPNNEIYIGDENNNRVRRLTKCQKDSDCGVCFSAQCIAGECTLPSILPVGAPCDNGIFCDGTDTCNGNGVCESNGNPCSNQPCIGCNEQAGTCGDPIGSSCVSDGLFTDTLGNQGNCAGGVCQAIVPFSEFPIAAVVAPVTIVFVAAVLVYTTLIIRHEKKKRRKALSSSNSVDLEQVGTVTNITVGEEIGKGNFGQVYKGQWNGAPVALKKLTDTSKLDQFTSEAQFMAKLNHMYIVQFFGIANDAKHGLLLVMQYMNHGNLRNALISKEINPQDFKIILIQILRGMTYLQQQSILHRDLSARNILLSVNDNKNIVAKVSDFGLGKCLGENEIYTSVSEMPIAVRWAGVEVLKKWTFSPKSDVWAFGVVMWEVYNEGKTPYENLQTNDQVVHFVSSGGTLQVPENCPKEHAEWMTLCWRLEPDARPSFAELLKAIDVNEIVQQDSSWKTASPSHQLRALYVPDE